MTAPVALVTGAATGIGAAVASVLSEAGYAVAVCDIDSAGVETVADGIVAAGGQALALPLDVTDAVAVSEAVARTVGELGLPTGVVTAAGVMKVSPFLSLTPQDWELTIRVNLTGTFLVLQACARAMDDAGSAGAMVALSSVAGRGPRADAADYAASKAGVISVVESAAVTLAANGIRVNAICPGVVDTDMTRRNAEGRAAHERISVQQALDSLVAAVPLGRATTPREVAMIAAQLLSDNFGYVTGQAINVCGGLEFD